MALVRCESFSWSNVRTDYGQRWSNSPAAGATFPAGRFAGNSLALAAGGWTMQLPAVVGPNFKVKMAFLPPSLSAVNLIQLADTGTAQVTLQTLATGLIQVRNGSAGTILGTTTVPFVALSWNFIEFAVLVNGAAGTVQVQLEGVSTGEINVAGVDTQQSAAAQVNQMIFNGNLWQICDLAYYDDVTMQGERRISLLTPTSDGALSDWTPSTGTSHFALVDEIPPNSDTDYLSSATAGQIELFGFSNLPFTPASVDGVQVSFWARKDDAGTREIATMVRSGGANFTGTTQTITSTYISYLQMYTTDPNTAAAWTGANVDAAEFGFNLIT